ncbi:MAG TPA: sensor histidine kinase [Gammaproteobacteria bacterium]|nr:sensor histidine kinase [Gammaproteobacteria bacterium]
MTGLVLKFPWIGIFFSLLVLAFFLVPDQSWLTAYVDQTVIDKLNDVTIRWMIFILLVAAYAFDYIRFRKSGRDYNDRIKKQNDQIDELFRSRNELQNKAHTYSGHADKLKLFISEKLLENIEYDEKFLHFKNIASEVRHNGVISYDKVVSVLNDALSQELDADLQQQYQDALDSMMYLWDLLDLSTTDNIAMYIANKLYECEEIYYRQVLDNNEISPPYRPVFPIRNAVMKAISGHIETAEPAIQASLHTVEVFQYDDKQCWIKLEESGNFLGNENYIVLVMENLINNALFYTSKRKYSSKYSRVSISLVKEGRDAVISVFNPGPEIPEEAKDKIYTLGYSTKRSKGHHGKGLGLYFVKEIIKGYEGEINYHNVHSVSNTYIIRVECESKPVVNEIIETALNDLEKIKVRQDDGSLTDESVCLIEDRIKSIEVSDQIGKNTQVFDNLDQGGKSVLLDPTHAARPAWLIEVNMSLTSTEISFKPLDTTGVEFTLRIPTAESRLDSEYHVSDQQGELAEDTDG